MSRWAKTLGAEVRLVPFPVVSQDLLTPLTAANDGDPDAIVALTADTGCVPVFNGAHDLGVEGATSSSRAPVPRPRS